jgi:hypothetical protein
MFQAPVSLMKPRNWVLRYLWGSSGLTQNLKFEKAFILHIANDEAGKPVAIGTEDQPPRGCAQPLAQTSAKRR